MMTCNSKVASEVRSNGLVLRALVSAPLCEGLDWRSFRLLKSEVVFSRNIYSKGTLVRSEWK